jgi:hypothetical protein
MCVCMEDALNAAAAMAEAFEKMRSSMTQLTVWDQACSPVRTDTLASSELGR